MNAPTGPIYAERMTHAQADALFAAFPGIAIYGASVAARLSAADVAADPDADMVTDATMQRGLAQNMRWAGVRDPLYDKHPVSVLLHAALASAPAAIPEPEPKIVDGLVSMGCVRSGNIVTCRGVPIPAGIAQLAYYIVLRYRPLYSPLADPAKIYRGDDEYDAAHVTDVMQESILLVSTRIYRDQLTMIIKTAPALFVAIWMRELVDAEALVNVTPIESLPSYYPRSIIKDNRRCLLITCDMMAEHERSFDLLQALRFIGGVTRRSVEDLLNSTTNLTPVYAVFTNTHQHVAAGAAHIRTVHPTMNRVTPVKSTSKGATRKEFRTKSAPKGQPATDLMFASIKNSFEHSPLYRNRGRRVIWVAGEMPTRYFLGVEPAKIIPVALIQMRETMVAHEGEFWQGARGKLDPFKDSLARRIMSLAVIETSAICVHTARHMIERTNDAMQRDSLWLRAAVMPLIRNPQKEEDLATKAKQKDDKGLHEPSATKTKTVSWVRDDVDFGKNTYRGASKRAKLCSPMVGQPGWTQGFRPDAWRRPDAEVEFLRNVCRYILFKQELAAKRDFWNGIIRGAGTKSDQTLTAADLPTGLPGQHPLERVQDLFRDRFDPLQVAEKVRGANQSDEWRYREAFVREIALMLPALCGITDDTQLNERFWVDRKSYLVRLACKGAWNT